MGSDTRGQVCKGNVFSTFHRSSDEPLSLSRSDLHFRTLTIRRECMDRHMVICEGLD